MARPQKPQLQQQQQQPQHVESQLRCQSEYICFFSGFFLQLLFTFKLLRIHFNWFSYKLLKICRFFSVVVVADIFVSTLELKFWWHIHTHIRTLAHTGYGIQTQTRTHTPTNTHTHTHSHVSARGRRQKGNREVYCCCRLRRVAWLERGGKGEQGEHVFLSILKLVFSAANCFSLRVFYILI